MLSKLYLYIIHSMFLLFYKKEYRKYMSSENILEIQENKLKEILSEEELELFNFNELASQIYRIKSNYNNIGYPIINSKK